MKEFLDRAKEQIREFLREVKENNKGNRTELLLMGLFILAFLALSVPELAKEASGGQVLEDRGQEEKAESERETQDEENTGLEGQTDSRASDTAESESGQSDGRGTDESELMTDSSESADEKNEPESPADEAESEDGAATGETGTEKKAAETELSSEQNETAADKNDSSSQESETEAAALNPEALDREWKRLQAQYGETFLFPMTAEADPADPALPELKNAMQLKGYDAILQWKPEKTLQTLKQQLEERIAGYDGEWSVYCKNLSGNESFVINDTPMKSASVMKLFIMGTVYTAFENGELTRTDEILNLLNNMIIYSDNGASNELLSKLGNGSYADGIAKVDAFIESHGFSDMTVEYNGFNDPATNTSSDHFNQVAARDCGKLLEDIYRRTWVNRTVSNEMESLLLSQDTRYKIPAGLPEGVLCGNKTGEMDTTENDAAIIYGKDCDYILVVLSSDWGSKDQAISRIAELSRITYQYLNPETDTAE